MFDDLPPLAADAEDEKVTKVSCSEEIPPSPASLAGNVKTSGKKGAANARSVGYEYNAALAFKPRRVTTGVVESNKIRRKESTSTVLDIHADIQDSKPLQPCVQNPFSLIEEHIQMMEVPAGLLLEPSVYAQLFETNELYDPAIPNDYEQSLSDDIDDECRKNLDRLNEEEIARRRRHTDAAQYDMRENSSAQDDLDSAKARLQSRRNICNLPAWLTEQSAANEPERAHDTSSRQLVDIEAQVISTQGASNAPDTKTSMAISYAPMLQVLDYSILSNTLSIVGVDNSADELLGHLNERFGAGAYTSEVIRKERECVIKLSFEDQASCIRTYYSLAQGEARTLCFQAGETPEVIFVII